MPSLRIELQMVISPQEKVHLRLQELETLDEKRLQTRQILKLYRPRMTLLLIKSLSIVSSKKVTWSLQ